MSRSTTLLYLSLLICLVTLFFSTESFSDQTGVIPGFESPLLVKKNQRKPIVATEFGEISAVQIGDGYHLQFITLESNSLLLPLLLHSDMVFFVHTGSGILSWIDDEKEKTLELKRGDVYRLRSGTVFYLHSNEVPQQFRVYAIFDVEKCVYDPCLGAYSSIRDLLFGFDDRTLQSAFAVPEDVLGRLRNSTKPPLIINALPRNRTQVPEENKWQSRLARLFVRGEDVIDHLAMRPIDSNKKKTKTYNVFEADPDFENDYGQSIVVDKKDLHALKHSKFGVFMVNLTKGSMMGPHWNPRATEISIVLRGEGMIRVVSQQSLTTCKSKSERFMVEEGDVFVVPKFHPMTQMSFENSSFVFMGFSTSVKKNYPQFLVGQSSVLKVLDPDVLALSFNLRNETVKRLLEAQKESLMFECVSCAEGELAKLIKEIEEKRKREEEEIERKKEEERKREEEAKRREEEIERRRREEEEARRRREEEEARRRREEEEARRRREEEEARRRREEEAAKKREEEAAKKREEEAEEARKREEERQREEEEAKRREEERKKHEEEVEEAKKREEERQREEEEAKRREDERKKHEEEVEEAKKREEERQREEEEAKRREEERKKHEEEVEEAKKREEERQREEEEVKRREEERRRREKEAEEARKREEEEMAKKREEERQKKEREEIERKRREEEAAKKREEERKREEEMAKKREEARQRKEREEIERKRREEAMRKREEEIAKKQEEERQRKAREEMERKRREEEARKREEERRNEENEKKKKRGGDNHQSNNHRTLSME